MEFRGVATLAPDRIAVAANVGDLTGAMNPYERAKVHIAYGYGLSGQGVNIGITDTGYNLTAGVPTHGEFSRTNSLIALATSPTFVSDAHGTHISGLAGGQRNGTAMQGVAFNSTVYVNQVGDTSDPAFFTTKFNEYRRLGVGPVGNSYGVNVNGDTTSAWRPVQTTATLLEVTTSNFLAYRDNAGLTSSQAMANVTGGTAAGWDTAVAAIAGFQAAGGIVVWANSNYGRNDIANGAQGLDSADHFAGLPLLYPQLQGGWIVVVNATSIGLGTQGLGQTFVNNSTLKEGNIILNSAQCGTAAAFCLSMDGSSVWSGSNRGDATYEQQTGTSQATPMVAGMLALLREAFPTSSAADLAARLLFTADNSFFVNNRTVSNITTASYTNSRGTITHRVSDIWGHGFPDLQVALNPVGARTTSTAAGQEVFLTSLNAGLSLGSVFGNAPLSRGDGRFLYTDVLNGIFIGNFADYIGFRPETRMLSSIGQRALDDSVASAETNGGLRMSFGQAQITDSVNSMTRTETAFSVRQKLAGGFELGAAFGFNPSQGLGLAPRHSHLRGASFTDQAMGLAPLGFMGRDQMAVSAGWQAGRLRASVAGFTENRPQRLLDRPMPFDTPLASGAIADVVYDVSRNLALNVTFGQLNERNGFLGSYIGTPGLNAGANSQFARFGFRQHLGPHFGAEGSYTVMTSQIQSGGPQSVLGTGRVESNAMAFNIFADDLAGKDSRLTLGVSQPLRATSAALQLDLPSRVLINGPGDWSYIYDRQPFSLSPSGQEIDVAAEYSKKFAFGTLSLTGVAISNAGHNAAAPLAFGGAFSLRVPLR